MATNYIAPTWRMPENTNKDKLSNYSLALDGESEYVTFPLTNFKGDDGTVSYSFWAKPNTYGGSTNYGYFLSASTRGGISYSEGGLSTGLVPGEIYLYDMTNTGVVVTTTGCILDENTWNHIVIVFNTGSQASVTNLSAQSWGLKLLLSAVLCTLVPCSSVPVKNQTFSPFWRCQRVKTSPAVVV